MISRSEQSGIAHLRAHTWNMLWIHLRCEPGRYHLLPGLSRKGWETAGTCHECLIKTSEPNLEQLHRILQNSVGARTATALCKSELRHREYYWTQAGWDQEHSITGSLSESLLSGDINDLDPFVSRFNFLIQIF
jgi:hypothetical protein